jgi:GAF domain-containing protein
MSNRQEWLRLLAQLPGDDVTRPEHICRLCVAKLGISGAGIAMVTDEGNRGVVCATDDASARIEELQFVLGEGPCIDAVAAGGPVLIPDLDHAAGVDPARWPMFREASRAAGVQAVFAFPLCIGAITVGVLDLYRDVPGDLDDDALAMALLAADTAALALLELDVSGEGVFDDDAGARSTYRLEVHQATGIVQIQLEVGAEVALVMLRARAFASGRSVAEVARDVVAHHLRFNREDG